MEAAGERGVNFAAQRRPETDSEALFGSAQDRRRGVAGSSSSNCQPLLTLCIFIIFDLTST